MKKVLVIGYPFPYRTGGSPRLLGLAKYLPEFSWQPIILTAPLDKKPDNGIRMIETEAYDYPLYFWTKLFKFSPDQDLRKQVKHRLGIKTKKSLMDRILTLIGEIVNYPDYDKNWKYGAVKTGEKLLTQEKIDAIISSSAPYTGHIIARQLKQNFRIPWIADLRDLWTQNHNYTYSRVRKWFDTRLELQTLAPADALVTVSRPWADMLQSLHKRETTYDISNGFDPEEINTPPAALTDKFTITHTGSIYDKQDPTLLLKALSSLIEEKKINASDVSVRLFGPRLDWLDSEIQKIGLSETFKQYGTLTRPESVQKQRESQILVHFKWEDESVIGGYSLKIFEYLGARRPILVTGGYGGDVLEELLRKTNTGVCSFTLEQIKNQLITWYKEYKEKGNVGYTGKDAEIMKYSHREMARSFSEILERITGNE